MGLSGGKRPRHISILVVHAFHPTVLPAVFALVTPIDTVHGVDLQLRIICAPLPTHPFRLEHDFLGAVRIVISLRAGGTREVVYRVASHAARMKKGE